MHISAIVFLYKMLVELLFTFWLFCVKMILYDFTAFMLFHTKADRKDSFHNAYYRTTRKKR